MLSGKTLLVLSAGATLGLGLIASSADAATLLAQYKVGDYNASTGVWTDSSSNSYDATSAGSTKPTIVTNVTPNGSSAVKFAGGQYLSIASGGVPSAYNDGYTVFAYVNVNGASSGTYGIVGSGKAASPSYSSGFGYALNVSATSTFQQQAFRTSQIGGTSKGAPGHATADFVNVNVAMTGPGAGSFRLNGAADADSSNAAYFDPATYPINTLGAILPDGTNAFLGQIAEVRIYSGALSEAERQTIEGELQATYVPEPASLSVLALGGLSLLARRRRMA